MQFLRSIKTCPTLYKIKNKNVWNKVNIYPVNGRINDYRENKLT
jgi:hypothetical protein